MKVIDKIWTSDLIVSTQDESLLNEDVRREVFSSIDSIEALFPSKFGKFKDQGLPVKSLCNTVVQLDGSGLFDVNDVMDFVNYRVPQDFTGLMKGIAIGSISGVLVKKGIKEFSISFGSDIMVVGRPTTLVSKYNPKFLINMTSGCSFTSGNDDGERGQHIKLYEKNPYLAVHVIDDTGFRPIFCDYAATYIYSRISEAKRWPHLKVIGMTREGAHLLNDGVVPEKKAEEETDA